MKLMVTKLCKHYFPNVTKSGPTGRFASDFGDISSHNITICDILFVVHLFYCAIIIIDRGNDFQHSEFYDLFLIQLSLGSSESYIKIINYFQ